MDSSQWFIIYIVLLLSSPISKFCTSGNIIGKYSKKDYNYLLKTCKEKFKHKFNIVNNDDIQNNKKQILKLFDNEKYKVFLLRIKNFLIGILIGMIISQYSLLSLNNKDEDDKEYNKKIKIIEKNIRSFLSIILLGFYPILLFLTIMKKEKNSIDFINSTYFLELFEIILGLISGYVLFYFLNKNKSKTKNFNEIKYDNITYVTIFILLLFLTMYTTYIFFKPS